LAEDVAEEDEDPAEEISASELDDILKSTKIKLQHFVEDEEEAEAEEPGSDEISTDITEADS